VVFYEDGNISSGPVQGGTFIDQLNESQLLKEESAPLNRSSKVGAMSTWLLCPCHTSCDWC